MRRTELNAGYSAYPLDDPRKSGFMDNLDTINALAEAMDHLAHLQKHGSTDQAFDWDFVDQSAWRRCTVAAEQIT